MEKFPSRMHQLISGNLARLIGNYLEGRDCQVYAAPFSVRLLEEDDNTSIFEPDISIVCDKSKLDKHGCNGAPDMVVEILSPSTARYDWLVKMSRYQRAGVKEYWIITPEAKTVHVFLLKDGKLEPYEVYTQEDIARVNVLDGCFIELARIFVE